MRKGGDAMEKPEKIEERTFKFALRVVRLARALPEEYSTQAMGRQMLRSGTSIGANVEEAIGAASKKDFANKMAIAAKEARETHYWLRLVRDAEIIRPDLIAPIIQESLELKKILSKTVSTARRNLRPPSP
jgi:four helix bundle protein